jgi:hemoglobin
MQITYYEKIGDENLKKLIHDFYQGIRNDPILKPMYKNDFEAAEERLYLFLIQYLGGPDLYNQKRGHPRLKMRHVLFPINEEVKQHWLNNMKNALEESQIEKNDKEYLWNYFRQTADFLKNR